MPFHPAYFSGAFSLGSISTSEGGAGIGNIRLPPNWVTKVPPVPTEFIKAVGEYLKSKIG